MVESAKKDRWLLAIDTSTEQAGLAVTNGGQTSSLSWLAGRDQTVTVLAQIDHLLTLTGIEAAAISAVGIATGPGMFNGLRVGMSLAKGFHFGLGADLIGVSTLEIGASPFAEIGFDIVSVVAAGRGRVIWQFFPEKSTPVNGTIDELASAIGSRAEQIIVAGNLTDSQADRIKQIAGAIVPNPSARKRKPGALAEIAWTRWSNGEIDDPIALAPVYLHATTAAARG